MSALGYAGTSGATFVHYLPVDRVAVPPPLSRHYVERNVHLPHSVHPAQHAAERATPLAHWRGAFGSRAVVGSWNSERKLGPNDWHLWGNVLRASPLTVLQQAVAWPEADSARRLGDELLAAGLHARRRLALPTRVSQSEHHARVRATDLGKLIEAPTTASFLRCARTPATPQGPPLRRRPRLQVPRPTWAVSSTLRQQPW